MDHPAGPQPRGGGAAGRDPLRDPGPGSEVLRALRRGVSVGGPEDHQDPCPRSEGERSRRAVGPHRSGRVPGLDAGARPPSPGADAPDVRGPYNEARPHRGLELKTPGPRPYPTPWPADAAQVRRRDVLGGLIHEYELAA